MKKLSVMTLRGGHLQFELLADGVPIHEVRRVTLDTGLPGEIAQMTVQVNFLPGSTLEYEAEVMVELVPPAGCHIERVEAEGKQVWRCVATSEEQQLNYDQPIDDYIKGVRLEKGGQQ